MILDKELYIKRGFFRGILISLKNSFFRIISSGSKSKKSSSLDRKINHDFGFRGIPRLKYSKEKKSIKCTSCNLCQKVCPTNCISIKSKGSGVTPKSFELDILKCIYCGFCVEICPEDALAYDRQKDLCGHAENNWKIGIDKLSLYTPDQENGD